MLKQRGGGRGVAVSSQEPLRSASSQDCGSCHGTFSGLCGSGLRTLASTSATRASSATCLHQIHACCLHTPSLGSILWAPVCLPGGAHSLPARTRTRSPQAAPRVVQTRFPAGGAPVKGLEVDLGRECKAPRLLSRWRTQDSAVVSGNVETPRSCQEEQRGLRMLVTRFQLHFFSVSTGSLLTLWLRTDFTQGLKALYAG